LLVAYAFVRQLLSVELDAEKPTLLLRGL
jgi:hypothetical protein